MEKSDSQSASSQWSMVNANELATGELNMGTVGTTMLLGDFAVASTHWCAHTEKDCFQKRFSYAAEKK